MEKIFLSTSQRIEIVDITSIVSEKVRSVENGVVVLYVPHTTAGVFINEGFDPTVREDLIDTLQRLVPYSAAYKHLEGNADAHIKSTLIGSSITVIVENGRLMLGRWQSIFFAEFDGPRRREVWLKTL